MQDVPKIVRARLQQPTPATAEQHPDADLLTAFAERSLAGRERDHVLEHLARCGDCRDVVALALPATEDVVPATSSTTPLGWFSLPVLRWGVVAAGVLAITSVGILQYRQRQDKTLVATSRTSRDQSTDSVAQNPAPTPQGTEAQANTPRTETRNQTEIAKQQPAQSRAQRALSADKPSPAPNAIVPQSQSTHHAASANAFHGSIGGPVAGLGLSSGAGRGSKAAQVTTPLESPSAYDSKNTTSAVIAQQTATPAAAQRASVPSATTTVEVSGEAPLITTETTAQNQTQIHGRLIQNEVVEPQPSLDHVGKAKSPSAQSSLVMAPAPLLHAEPALVKGAAAPRWTISASGALQRSTDGGKTWQDVDVAVNDSMSANFVRRAPATAKSAPAESAARPIFRAVSVSSNVAEVWAGGSGGALYHTLDGGNRWTRVLPSQAGVLLTGDIIAIQFSDPGNGIVTTSTAQIWATTDAGQTWRKQQ